MSKNVEQLIVLSKCVELCRTAAQTIDAIAKGGEYTKAEQRWIIETKDRITQRRGNKPAKKAGQLRALWPEIRTAIAEGQRLAMIRQRLEEEAGIVATFQSLGSYLTRIRRKEQATPSAPTPWPKPKPRFSSFAMFHQLLYCQSRISAHRLAGALQQSCLTAMRTGGGGFQRAYVRLRNTSQ